MIAPVSYCLNPDCPQPHALEQNPSCPCCGQPGSLWERYRAVEPIASGGFGRTLLGCDTVRGLRCAIKQLAWGSAQAANAPLQREARRLQQLGQHAQIPHLLAHGKQQRHYYLVQEFVPGRSLARELDEGGAFDEAQVRRLLLSLLPVLAFIHRGKVIHRDIKPANIICRQAANGERCGGPPALVDFGSAKEASATALGKTGTLVGSAGYAAPEQVLGKATFASDLYSLGITCIQLLTQLEPFDLYQPSDGRLVWRDCLAGRAVSERLAAVLDAMTQRAVGQRYRSAEAVMRDLRRDHQRPSGRRRGKRRSPALLALWDGSPTQARVAALAFAPNGRLLASGHQASRPPYQGQANGTRLWHPACRQALRDLPQPGSRVTAVAFDSSSHWLASGGRDRAIRLWEAPTGRLHRTIARHRSAVHAVAFTPTGQWLASGSADGTVRLWQVRTGRCVRVLEGGAGEVYAVAIDPSGQIVAGGTRNGTVRLWSLPQGKLLPALQGHADGVTALAFAPQGQVLASGSGDWDCSVRLWSLRSSQAIRSLTAHTWSVTAIAFDPTGRLLASGSSDGTFNLWQPRTGRRLRTLEAQSGAIRALAISPDGTLLAGGGDAGTIELWQLR